MTKFFIGKIEVAREEYKRAVVDGNARGSRVQCRVGTRYAGGATEKRLRLIIRTT